MKEDKLDSVMQLLQEEKSIEARRIFKDIVPDETAKYYYVKGLLEQKFQNWGEAINAYSKVLELEPGNEEAHNNLHIILPLYLEIV